MGIFNEDSPDYRIWAVKTALTSELDLSGFNLSEIPQAVFPLPGIKTLIIANYFPFPDSFGVGDTASINEDTHNDPDLSEKKKRQIVALWRKHYAPSEAKILGLSEAIVNLESLEVLDLTGQALTSLPASISRSPRIRKLHLSRNQLRALPRDFARLRTPGRTRPAG